MGAYSDQVVADGALHYWRLGEGTGLFLDAVGGAHGTATAGAMRRNEPGALVGDANGAVFLSDTVVTIGDGAYITLPTITLPVPGSLEVWVRSVTGSGTRIVWTNRSGAIPTNALIGINGVGAAEFGNNAAGTAIGTTRVDDDAWHHLVGTNDGTALRIYVDGVLQHTRAVTLGATTGVAAIGWDNFVGVVGNTTIDEIAIYPTALTLAQAAAHYTLGTVAAGGGWPWWIIFDDDDEGEGLVKRYNVWEPITPSNTVDLPRGLTGGVYVGGGGDVAAVMENNLMPAVFPAVPAGAWLPVAARRINATGTTATGLVALYEV